MKKLSIDFNEMPYAIEEAMNRLRINIKFCGKNTKKLLITSSLPNEGKSTISINLWKMMAEAGFPTVFLDVDLRKSVIKGRHNMKSESEIKDLGYYLSGQAEYEDVVYETNIPNAYIVPCCNLLENPSALLEDARFAELLDKLAEQYRYVIIDSPPLGSVADAAQVASLCDGAVLVVRSGETSRNVIRQSMQQLEQVNCRLLGVILNRVEASGRAYKSYYGKYGKDYGYGYGYGEKNIPVKRKNKMKSLGESTGTWHTVVLSYMCLIPTKDSIYQQWEKTPLSKMW